MILLGSHFETQAGQRSVWSEGEYCQVSNTERVSCDSVLMARKEELRDYRTLLIQNMAYVAEDKQKILLSSDTGHFSLIRAMHLADVITEMNGKILFTFPDPESQFHRLTTKQVSAASCLYSLLCATASANRLPTETCGLL